MFHEPARGFRAEKYTNAEDEGRNECGTELKAPGNITGVLDNHVGSESKEDTCVAHQ